MKWLLIDIIRANTFLIEWVSVYKIYKYGRKYLREFKVFPPQGVSVASWLPSKSNCISLNVCGFLHQQSQPVTSFQHFLYIIHHHIPHLRQIPMFDEFLFWHNNTWSKPKGWEKYSIPA